MNANMLSRILFSCLLLSVPAQSCTVSEIIRHTTELLKEKSLHCPCRETAVSPCLCLPIAEPGHELACFVEGTERMLRNNISSSRLLTRLNQSFQIQLDRKLCESLARGNKCQYKTMGNVQEFLDNIKTTYQAIYKDRILKKNN